MKEKLVEYFEFQMRVMDRIGAGERGSKRLIWYECYGAVDFVTMAGMDKDGEVEALWKEWSEKLQKKMEE